MTLEPIRAFIRALLVNLVAAVLMMAGLWFLLLPSPRRTS